MRTRFEFYVRVYLDLYYDLVILELRRRGELPAVEGIRIVEERREEETETE